MTFNIYQLDQLDYEQVESLLDDYIDNLIEQFISSAEGEIYALKHEEIGVWISPLIDYGYQYEGVTLPQMMVENMEIILEELFPRKICLSSEEEASVIIPELITFWQFLQREYQLTHSSLILEYLDEIKDNYPDIMNDPSQFGMAKSLVMMGQQSGFDMSTQEGLDAFTLEYNTQMIPQLIEESEPTEAFSGSPSFEQLLFEQLLEEEKEASGSVSPKRKPSGNNVKKWLKHLVN